MQQRHRDRLLNSLEDVWDFGTASIRRLILLEAFGKKRVTKTVFQGLAQMWSDIGCGDTPLLVGIAGEGREKAKYADVFVFVYGQGVTVPDNDRSWLHPISWWIDRDDEE